jgi:hypothetical protein
MVSAWPEPPSAMSAERSAGVRDGMEAFALGTTETPPGSYCALSRPLTPTLFIRAPLVSDALLGELKLRHSLQSLLSGTG